MRKFITLLVATSVALGAEFNDKKLVNLGNGAYSYTQETSESLDISTLLGSTLPSPISKITISAPNAIINVNESVSVGEKYNHGASIGGNSWGSCYDLSDEAVSCGGEYAFEITAKEVNFKGISNPKELDADAGAELAVYSEGKINANVNLDTATLSLANGAMEDNTDKTRIDYYSGSLLVNGDFTAKNSVIGHLQLRQGGIDSTFVVSGKSTITNTEFAIAQYNVIDNTTLKYTLMTSLGGFNNDILTSNTSKFYISKSVYMLERQYNFTILDEKNNDKREPSSALIEDVSVKPTLKLEGSNLILQKTLNGTNLKDLQTKILDIDIALIEYFKADKTNQGNNIYPDDEIAKFDELKAQLEKQKADIANQNDTDIAQGYNKKDMPAGDILLSALGASQNIRDYAGTAIMLDILYNDGKGIVSNIVDTAKASTQTTTMLSPTETMNISNDISISTRIAKANNPFANLAVLKKLKDKNFTTLFSDSSLYYLVNQNYTQNVWGNAFGGANIIEGKTGALYGVSVGYEQRSFKNDALTGLYFSYANATFKDKILEQKSNNFQLGVYGSLNLTPKTEFNLKLYAQFAPTTQTAFSFLGDEIKSDFTRDFVGFSASGGRIFDLFDNVFFIKPFAGVNYFYTYTPRYTQSGDLAQNIHSLHNHSASVELGSDFRGYLNAFSFWYISPKIEQYILNKSEDYMAGFVGSPVTFAIQANETKKTYAQILLGGNVDITEQCNLNFGLGAKQIIAGKTQNKNETYITGNLGFKYRF